ncbi:MAG: AsmA-like C-terminal region-containing protein, partial [Candidatus Omnitrophota bacterium]
SLTFKDNRLNADSKIQCNKITALKDKITLKLNSTISAGVNYNLKDKQLAYSGSADIIDTNVSGIEAIGEINDISARINFDNQGLSSDKIIANCFGLNLTAKAWLSDFNNPVVSLELKSESDLKSAQNILSQKFKLSLPAELSGKGQLWVKLETSLPPKEMPALSGSLELVSAQAVYKEFGLILKNINGPLEFNLNQLSWADISFDWLDSSYKTEGSLSNFKDPLLSLKLSSSGLNLSRIQEVISEKFKLKVPVNIAGSGKLALKLKTGLPAREIPQIDGSLDISSADIKITEFNQSLTGVRGHLEFTQNTLNWSKVNFNYLDTAYASEGRMKNFLSPLIDLELSSAELKLKSNILLNNKLIKISALEGKYLNSNISLSGTINSAQSKAIYADINAALEIDLKNLEKPLAKFKDQLEKIKPKGIIKAKLNLNGNINDLKSAQGHLRLESSSLSLYGLKPEELLLDYNQANRLADIPLLRVSLYGGTIDANAKVNLDSPSLPFKLELGVQEIKIEKLKQDTPLKTQDLSGTLEAITKLNGLLTDFSKLSGSGKVLIKEGRLWQLNFFKGIGEILFTKDFANVVFNEGYCEFFIKDQFLFTDNLRLRSNIVDLEGKGKVGFDGTLDAAINTQVSEGLTPETGTMKDFTTALLGQAGRFGVIKLSGTIQEPKYKFQATVTDVMKGLKDFVIGNIFGQ